jgi:phosphate transport system permease protein
MSVDAGPGAVGALRRQYGRILAEASARASARRRLVAAAMAGLATLAILLALFPLVDIVLLVLVRGAGGLNFSIFSEVTSGIAGGLQNAILGTIALTGLGLVIAAPLGIATGVFMAEWTSARLAAVLGYLCDVLVGVPSIVVGYFGFVLFVGDFGWGFSWLAGAISLSVIMMPYIARTTQLTLAKVPGHLREGSLALGVTRARTTQSVMLPAALPGILTGILLAMGIGLGETAPLLYTASWSNYNPTLALTHSPVGYLTYVVWTFIQEPFSSAHRLAYVAALLLMASVLAINLVARQLLAHRQARAGA